MSISDKTLSDGAGMSPYIQLGLHRSRPPMGPLKLYWSILTRGIRPNNLSKSR